MVKIRKILGLLLQSLLYFISFFVPKNKNIWIFGSWTGNTFSDNPKYLYLYIVKHYPQIRCIYICKDIKLVENLMKEGMEAYYYYSIKGCLLAMHARVAFITAAHYDVNAFCCARILYIQLFHGTPIKKIYEDDRINQIKVIPKWKSFLIEKILKFLVTVGQNDYITIASLNVAPSFETAFKTTRRMMLVTGLARTDAYIKPLNNKYIIDLKNRIDGPLIAYLPTHRNYGKHEKGYVDIMQNLEYINEILKDNNIYMLYKPHFNELVNLDSRIFKYDHIIIPEDDECMSDVYAFTPYCDLLITDYSSVYLDYLLVDKPIVFFIYDFEHYTNSERDFYYDYNQVTPGPKCYTWIDTINEALRLLKKDDMAEQRSKTCVFFNQYKDGNSCERIYQEVSSIVFSERDKN